MPELILYPEDTSPELLKEAHRSNPDILFFVKSSPYNMKKQIYYIRHGKISDTQLITHHTDVNIHEQIATRLKLLGVFDFSKSIHAIFSDHQMLDCKAQQNTRPQTPLFKNASTLFFSPLASPRSCHSPALRSKTATPSCSSVELFGSQEPWNFRALSSPEN